MAYASRFLRIMSPFMEGIDIENVQVRLTELGYYEGEVINDLKGREILQQK